MVFAAKNVAPIAALEAAIPDVAALVFASLGIALALHGRQAIRARVLNVGAVATSIAMNMLAAGHGFRDLAIWVMPPVAYALASDTAIGVIRSHAIARQRELREALAGDETTPLAVLGGAGAMAAPAGYRPAVHPQGLPRLGARFMPGRSRPPRRGDRSERGRAACCTRDAGQRGHISHRPGARSAGRGQPGPAAQRAGSPRRPGSWLWSRTGTATSRHRPGEGLADRRGPRPRGRSQRRGPPGPLCARASSLPGAVRR